MKTFWLSPVVIAALLLATIATIVPSVPQAAAAEPVTIRALFMKQAGYQESDIEAITKEFEAQNPDIKVELEFVTYEALHDKIVTAAAAKAGTYDVVLIDCIWPAEFAAAGFIMDVTDRIPADTLKDIFTGPIEAVTYKDRLYAMPWLNDVLYLYYNDEMLGKAGFDHPPKTWSELKQMGLEAKKKGLVEYPFIEYFKQDEGLTIAFSYYLLAFGGQFVDADFNPTFNSAEGLAALEFMVDGMKQGLYNPASLESTYEEVRHTFSQGSALFSLNWAYQLNLANDANESKIAGHAKVALMPGEKLPSVTINGGMGLSITSDSKHPDEAWKYITYLSSKDVQLRYSANALPIWISLFDDPKLAELQLPVAREMNFIELSKQQYQYIKNRPLVPFYTEMSQIIAREVQAALTGTKTPQQTLADAEKAVKEVRDAYMQAP
jgi:multiple sugar transport system substrate-binding protein